MAAVVINDLSEPVEPVPNASRDPLKMRPRLRQGLRFDARVEDGAEAIVIEDTLRNKFFQVGAREFAFISQFDGSCDLQTAIERARSAQRFKEVTGDEAVQIVQWLASANLLSGGGETQVERLRRSASRQATWRSWSRWNLISFRWRMWHPEPALEHAEGLARLVFSRGGLIAWLVLLAAGWYCVGDRWDQVMGQTATVFTGYRWLWMLLLFAALKLVHEMGHALACKRFKVPVSEAGIVFILFAPLAYVDVTASWRLASRRQRMIIAAAGIYTELAVAAAAAALWVAYPSGVLADVCQQTILLASLTTVFFNANPLMRFDGYYLLSDALGIVNLYGKGSAWLKDRWFALVWGIAPTAATHAGWRGAAIAVYGVAAFLWRIALTTGILVVASVMFDGAGLILAAVGGIFWFGIPIVRHVRELKTRWLHDARARARWWRPIIAASCGLALASWLLVIPAPHCVPAVVEFRDEQIIRARSDGFLREILVDEGQQVQAGQTLLILENPQLEVAIQTLQAQIDSSRLTIRMLQGQGDIAASQAEAEHLRGLQQQLDEQTAWREGQRLVAPIDGIVVARGLRHRLGTFAKQGDALLSLVNPRQIEVIVALDQPQADAMREPRESGYVLQLAGFRRIPLTLQSIDAKASDQLPHSALGAHLGGPLPVRPAAGLTEANRRDASMRLTAPSFSARLIASNDVQAFVAAGERGYVRLSTTHYPRAWQWLAGLRHWLNTKLRST